MPDPARPAPDAPVDVVFFDLDDTLCEYPQSYASHLEDAFEAVGVDPFFDPLDVRRHAGDVRAETPLDFRKQCFTAIAHEQGREADVAIAVAEAFEEPAYEDVIPRPGAERAVRTLGERYTLGLVTNTTPAAMETKLEAIGLTDAFAVRVAQDPTVDPKPEPDMFDRALDALEATPHQAIHIGNSTVSDVAGAHAAGIRSVWIPTDTDGGSGPDPTFHVEDLHALAETPPWRVDYPSQSA
ncbi:MAG: HAD family hydrolase [Halobacteriaceae archaeon]